MDKELKDIFDGNDWFLQNLIGIVNGNDQTIPITLNVGGFLISGYLVGGQKYFSGFGEDFASPFKDEEVQKTLKNTFSKYGEIYTDNDDKEEKMPPMFIHLKDAKFFSTNGKPIPENRGVWWRGRVSEVGGFMLGTLSEK